MKKLLIFFTPFILFIISFILSLILMPTSFIYTILRSIKHGGLNKYFYDCAFSIDQSGNVICQHLLNDLMVKPDGERHGDPDKTISHVTGKNKLKNKQYKIGKFIANILNKIDKDHVEKAANNEQ